MVNLYGVVGEKTYKQILADPQGADVIAVPAEPGNGLVPAGTIMYRKSNGMYAPAATANVTTSNQCVVLKYDIDTGDTPVAGDIAEDAAAYRAGCFVDGNITLASGAALSDSDKAVLRLQNIVFDVDDSAAAFDNGTYKITYKANNGSEEEDVEFGAIAGSTYTVLNNSDSKLGFTAPDTKSFSKWNTAEDGSGTDYAAAATYTVAADLVLYAVWA